MKAQRKSPPITHEELHAAIRKFQKAGGIITKLPDQRAFGNQPVALKWGLLDTRPESPA